MLCRIMYFISPSEREREREREREMSMSVCTSVVTTLNDTDLKLLEHCELKAATKNHQVYTQLIQLTRVSADR